MPAALHPPGLSVRRSPLDLRPSPGIRMVPQPVAAPRPQPASA